MELGQAAQEAMDLRVSAVEQRMEADGKPLTGRELLSMNLLADQALALYNHFLRCYDVEAQLEEAVAPAKKPEDSAAAAAAADRKVKHSPAAPTCIRTREAMIAAVAQGAVAKVRLSSATPAAHRACLLSVQTQLVCLAFGGARLIARMSRPLSRGFAFAAGRP